MAQYLIQKTTGALFGYLEAWHKDTEQFELYDPDRHGLRAEVARHYPDHIARAKQALEAAEAEAAIQKAMEAVAQKVVEDAAAAAAAQKDAEAKGTESATKDRATRRASAVTLGDRD